MKNLFYLALAFVAVSASAQAQTPFPLQWSTAEASRYLETKGNETHLKPRLDGTGPDKVTATAQINLPDTTKWQASFDVRFGILSDQASSVHLLRGDHEVGWVGADGFYKKMGVFVGKDAEVVSPTADTEWHHVSYISDGTILTAWLDNKQVGTGPAQNIPNHVSFSNSQDMHVPCHQEGVWLRNFSVGSVQPAAANSSATFLPQPREHNTVTIQENDKTVYCVLGDTVHLTGTVSGQHRLSKRSFEINDTPYILSNADANENGYAFDWKPSSIGNYNLAVKFILQKPYDVLPIKNVAVIVLKDSPLALGQFLKPVPSNTLLLVQTIDATSFQPSHVDFFLANQLVGSASQAPFQVTLPISKQLPGSYDVSYQAYDAHGARLSGETETVTVPLRVNLTTPTSLTLTQEKQTVSLAADIVPGLKIVRVTYSVGDQEVASNSTPPYSVATKLSQFKSGSYPIKAEVLIEDGEIFCNPPRSIDITNKPDDERIIRLAKQETDRQARLQQEEKDRQVQAAKRADDALRAKIVAEGLAKQAEEKYKSEVANNTVEAVKSKRIFIALDGGLTKIGNSYWLTLKITNNTNKAIGPIDPDMHFDDFTSSVLLPYDTNLAQPFDEYGFPAKILVDSYHDLVVPPNSTKSISYFASNITAAEKFRKPARLGFVGTLRVFSLKVTP